MNPTPHEIATQLATRLHLSNDQDISLEYSKLSKSELQYTFRYLQKKFQQLHDEFHVELNNQSSLLRGSVKDWLYVEKSVKELDEQVSILSNDIDSFSTLTETIVKMSERKEEQDKLVVESQSMVCLLNYIQFFNGYITLYDECMGHGDYNAASQAVVNATKVQSELVNSQESIQLIPILFKRFGDIHQGIQTSLEYIFDQAFQLSISDKEYKITIKPTIEFGFGVPPAHLQSCVSAALNLGILDTCLSPFCSLLNRKLLKSLLSDFMESHIYDIKTIESCLLITRVNEEKKSFIVDNPLIYLDLIFEFLYSCCQFLDSHTELMSSFANLIYPEASELLLSLWIQPLIPNTFQELESFPQRIGSPCSDFESKWIQRGLIPNTQTLTQYCSNMSSHYLSKNAEKLYAQVRNIVFSNKHDYQIISESMISSKNLQVLKNPSFKSPFLFPKCATGAKSLEFLQIFNSKIQESILVKHDSYCFTRMYSMIRNALELYLFLMKSRNPDSIVPQLAMTMYNDFHYISRECLLLRLKYPSWPIDYSFADISECFRQSAIDLYNSQMNDQFKALLEILDSLQSLQMQHQNQLESIDKIITQVLFHIESTHKSWSQILSSHMQRKSIGKLLEFTFTRLIREVQDLKDIAEQESLHLHSQLSRFRTFEKLFSGQEPSKYTSNYDKFYKLVAVLQMKMADIQDYQKKGMWKEFTNREMINLIKALFADTPLRLKCCKLFE